MATTTSTLDYVAALSSAHDEATTTLERSREQLAKLLRTLDQQRAEIRAELDRVERALATIREAAPVAEPEPEPETERPRRRARRKAAATAKERPPQPGTNAYRVAQTIQQLGSATARTVHERTGVDDSSVHHMIRRLMALGWVKAGTKQGRTQSYDWSGPKLDGKATPGA